MARGAVSVDEAPWVLVANDRLVAGGTFTPYHPEALGVGRLLAEGYVVDLEDLHAIEAVVLDPGVTHVRARISGSRSLVAEAERLHRHERACGLLHFVACDPHSLVRDRSRDAPPAEQFPDHFRTLFRATEERHPGGGMHAAALFDGDRLLHQCEDVGRHNAVDRAIGEGWMSGLDLSQLGLVLSARVSGQIALSAARAGIAWVASRSVPTTLAVAIAGVAGMPIIGRAAGPHAHVFRGRAGS
jgi:FdhD protein